MGSILCYFIASLSSVSPAKKKMTLPQTEEDIETAGLRIKTPPATIYRLCSLCNGYYTWCHKAKPTAVKDCRCKNDDR